MLPGTRSRDATERKGGKYEDGPGQPSIVLCWDHPECSRAPEKLQASISLLRETQVAVERGEERQVPAFLLPLQCLKTWVLEPSAKLGIKSQLIDCIKDLKSIALLK